jgi:hypothetical protein
MLRYARCFLLSSLESGPLHWMLVCMEQRQCETQCGDEHREYSTRNA